MAPLAAHVLGAASLSILLIPREPATLIGTYTSDRDDLAALIAEEDRRVGRSPAAVAVDDIRVFGSAFFLRLDSGSVFVRWPQLYWELPPWPPPAQIATWKVEDGRLLLRYWDPGAPPVTESHGIRDGVIHWSTGDRVRLRRVAAPLLQPDPIEIERATAAMRAAASPAEPPAPRR